MAEAGEPGGLKTVLEQLCSSRNLQLRPEPRPRVAVIGIDRYLNDERAAESYSYDVTVTDGQIRVKCVLSSALHVVVQKNRLSCGCCVHISLLSLVYDERRLGLSYVCVEELDCADEDDDDGGVLSSIKDLNTLQWWTQDGVGNSVVWQKDTPLQTSRKHYLSLWNNEDPQGSVWIPNTPPPDVVIDVSKICLLGDLEVFFSSCRRSLPLLVRVLHRSRLRFYGKPGQNIDFPFQAYFEVADQSGVMSMVLWNDLCPEWYHRLQVGSVLYLQNFTLKKSYQNRSRPQTSHLNLITFTNTEICLNPRNPAAVVTVIPPKSVQPQWSLPDVTYNFSTRSEIESLPSNQACDIIGLVTYVGRVERIRNRGNSIPEKFWTYRWVHAVDGTSDSPFILEIFASSQPDIFNNICPMTYLVCTQMRVSRESGCSVYLTSSSETQIFITGCHKKQPYVSDPKVKAFIQWTKTLKDSVILKKTSVGGHYCYPPPPPTFTTTTSTNTTNNTSETGSVVLIAVADLQGEIESLQYREHRRLAVQGYITAVQYHSWPEEALQSEQHTPQRQQAEGGAVASGTLDLEESERVSPAPPADTPTSPKRRRLEPTRVMQRQYWTRAKVQSEKQVRQVDEDEDEGQSEEEEDEEERSDRQSGVQSPQTDDSQTVSQCPSASWESRVWAGLKQEVAVRVSSAPLHQESLPEKFCFDDRDVLLHQINLSQSRWSPDLHLNTHSHTHSHSRTHTPVQCEGYFTLSILGLNQQAVVDAVFVPVVSAEDPRAVGMPAGLHDNTLMTCLSTSPVCLSAESLLDSASALEDQRLVCVLDVCLLAHNQLEIICSKIYRIADITAV